MSCKFYVEQFQVRRLNIIICFLGKTMQTLVLQQRSQIEVSENETHLQSCLCYVTDSCMTCLQRHCGGLIFSRQREKFLKIVMLCTLFIGTGNHPWSYNNSLQTKTTNQSVIKMALKQRNNTACGLDKANKHTCINHGLPLCRLLSNARNGLCVNNKRTIYTHFGCLCSSTNYN